MRLPVVYRDRLGRFIRLQDKRGKLRKIYLKKGTTRGDLVKWLVKLLLKKRKRRAPTKKDPFSEKARPRVVVEADRRETAISNAIRENLMIGITPARTVGSDPIAKEVIREAERKGREEIIVSTANRPRLPLDYYPEGREEIIVSRKRPRLPLDYYPVQVQHSQHGFIHENTWPHELPADNQGLKNPLVATLERRRLRRRGIIKDQSSELKEAYIPRPEVKEDKSPSLEEASEKKFQEAKEKGRLAREQLDREDKEKKVEQLKKLRADRELVKTHVNRLQDALRVTPAGNERDILRDTVVKGIDKLAEMKEQIAELEKTGSGHADLGISNFDIEKIMRKYKPLGFMGVLMCDEIPTLVSRVKPRSRISFILNSDPSSKPGRHWTACYIDARTSTPSPSLEYYNSFGDPPSQTFLRDIKKVVDKLNPVQYLRFKINKIHQQNDHSSSCGYFACHFLIGRYRGEPFKEVSGYDDSVAGEKMIDKFKRQEAGVIKGGERFNLFTGGSLLGNIQTAVTGRTEAPPAVRSLLAHYGDRKVLHMKVFRQPVSGVVTKLLNLISGGQLEANRKKYHYDQVFHLYLLIVVAGPGGARGTSEHRFNIERNVTLKVSPPRGGADYKDVTKVRDLTLASLLEGASRGKGNAFWRYDPTNNNCQAFCIDMIRSAGGLTPELKSFIYQDPGKLLEHSPLTTRFAQGITNLGHKFDILISGKGRI
jgi:hypothetical protein